MRPTAVIVMLVLMSVLCLALVSCGVITAFLEAAGVPVSPAAKAGARQADEAIGWSLADYVFGGSVLLNVLGGAQRGHAAVKRRKAKRTSTHITPPPVV